MQFSHVCVAALALLAISSVVMAQDSSDGVDPCILDSTTTISALRACFKSQPWNAESQAETVDIYLQALDFYVHLDSLQDGYNYGNDVDLRQELEDLRDREFTDDWAFQTALFQLIRDARDLDSEYTPPSPYSECIASLPLGISYTLSGGGYDFRFEELETTPEEFVPLVNRSIALLGTKTPEDFLVDNGVYKARNDGQSFNLAVLLFGFHICPDLPLVADELLVTFAAATDGAEQETATIPWKVELPRAYSGQADAFENYYTAQADMSRRIQSPTVQAATGAMARLPHTRSRRQNATGLEDEIAVPGSLNTFTFYEGANATMAVVQLREFRGDLWRTFAAAVDAAAARNVDRLAVEIVGPQLEYDVEGICGVYGALEYLFENVTAASLEQYEDIRLSTPAFTSVLQLLTLDPEFEYVLADGEPIGSVTVGQRTLSRGRQESNYTALFKGNCPMFVQPVPTPTNRLPATNIFALSHGLCMGPCSVFVELLDRNTPANVIALGGRQGGRLALSLGPSGVLVDATMAAFASAFAGQAELAAALQGNTSFSLSMPMTEMYFNIDLNDTDDNNPTPGDFDRNLPQQAILRFGQARSVDQLNALYGEVEAAVVRQLFPVDCAFYETINDDRECETSVVVLIVLGIAALLAAAAFVLIVFYLVRERSVKHVIEPANDEEAAAHVDKALNAAASSDEGDGDDASSADAESSAITSSDASSGSDDDDEASSSSDDASSSSDDASADESSAADSSS